MAAVRAGRGRGPPAPRAGHPAAQDREDRDREAEQVTHLVAARAAAEREGRRPGPTVQLTSGSARRFLGAAASVRTSPMPSSTRRLPGNAARLRPVHDQRYLQAEQAGQRVSQVRQSRRPQPPRPDRGDRARGRRTHRAGHQEGARAEGEAGREDRGADPPRTQAGREQAETRAGQRGQGQGGVPRRQAADDAPRGGARRVGPAPARDPSHASRPRPVPPPGAASGSSAAGPWPPSAPCTACPPRPGARRPMRPPRRRPRARRAPPPRPGAGRRPPRRGGRRCGARPRAAAGPAGRRRGRRCRAGSRGSSPARRAGRGAP